MTLDLSHFKIYVDNRCIYPFNNFIPRGDKVILEFLNKIKWLKTSNILCSNDNIYSFMRKEKAYKCHITCKNNKITKYYIESEE